MFSPDPFIQQMHHLSPGTVVSPPFLCSPVIWRGVSAHLPQFPHL